MFCRFIFALSLALCSAAFSDLSAGQLHAIIVGDTFASDIREGVLADMISLENHVLDAAKHSRLVPHAHHMTASQACSSKVLESIHSLSVEIDDVIIFYFSGHGYRTPSKEENPWPNIYFSTDQTGIDLLEIANLLVGKQARLSIVIADCCNSSLPSEFAPPVMKKPHPIKIDHEKIARNFGKLFIESKGLVLIASSKAGQSSWAVGAAGSLYTGAYMDAFKNFVRQADTSALNWQAVLDYASYRSHETASKYGIVQDPIYKILP